MLAERLRFGAGLAWQNPPLLVDYLRWFADEFRPHPILRSQEQPDAISLDQARAILAERYGDWTDGPALAELREFQLAHRASSGITAGKGGDGALGLLGYWVIRALRPQTAVETGVETGVTSGHLLAGIQDNGRGILRSIDLPSIGMVKGQGVGSAIPPAWKAGWDYRWGSARRLLPRTLPTAAPAVFLHDSDHRRPNMVWELSTALRRLRPGSAILCHDADFHGGFRATAAAFGAVPLFVGRATGPGTTGLLLL